MTLPTWLAAATAAQALAWLLTYTLHSTLLLGLAWGISWRLGRRSLGLQETLWRCALVGGLITASAQLAFGQLGRAPLAGGWTLVAPAVESAAAGAPAAGEALVAEEALAASPGPQAATHGTLAPRGDSATAPDGRAAIPSPAAAARTPAPQLTLRDLARRPAGKARALLAPGAVVAAWLLGAVLLCGAYLRSYLSLRRLLRYRPQVVGGGVLVRLGRLVRGAGISRSVRLTCTWKLRVPVALGGRARELCVPPRALFQLSDRQQDALLAHELAHLERRDPVWLVVTHLAASVFFFQPLNWLAQRRLRELSELLCDQWAVAHTGEPLSLAGCLAEVASWTIGGGRKPPRLPVPGMAGRPSQLAHRIRRLLDGAPVEGRAPARRQLIAVQAVVLVAVALAAPGVSAGSSGSQAAAGPCIAGQGAASCVASPAAAGPSATPCVAATAAAGPQAAPCIATTGGTAAPSSAAAAPKLAQPSAATAAMVAAQSPAMALSLAQAPLAAAGRPSAAIAAGEPADAGSAAVAADVADTMGPAEAGDLADADAAAIAAETASPPSHSSARSADAAHLAGHLAAEHQRLAAMAAHLAGLDKLDVLSGEQIRAIAAAAERISREIDGRMHEQLADLERRMAAARPALAHPPQLPARELAHLEADLADMAAHLHPSADEMARLETELRKLAADPPHLSAREIDHLERDMRNRLKDLPHLGLPPADLERLHQDMARALEQGLAATHVLSPAEREKIIADAHRLADRFKPDQAQLDALRDLERQHHELTRQLDRQRADLESMRHELQQQADSLRDLAHHQAESHRIRPHLAPVPRTRHTPPLPPPAAAAPTAPGSPPAASAPPHAPNDAAPPPPRR